MPRMHGSPKHKLCDRPVPSVINSARKGSAGLKLRRLAMSERRRVVSADQFYSDDIEGSSETMKESLRGKERVRSILLSFLAPLHAMAEVGGVSISIRETAIPGDAPDETHSAWTLELVGVSGKICSVNWRILRKWNESGVVLEHHYDYRQNGEPLTEV